jgi:hypothetical protein
MTSFAKNIRKKSYILDFFRVVPTGGGALAVVFGPSVGLAAF